MAAFAEVIVKWLNVGKTVVPFQQGTSRFILLNEGDTQHPVRTYATLEELAWGIKATKPKPTDEEIWLIKNDLPSVIWRPDDTVQDRFDECERLDKHMLHSLVMLLRQ